MFRPERRRNEKTGGTYPWLVQSNAMVNHFYVYCVDRDFGLCGQILFHRHNLERRRRLAAATDHASGIFPHAFGCHAEAALEGFVEVLWRSIAELVADLGRGLVAVVQQAQRQLQAPFGEVREHRLAEERLEAALQLELVEPDPLGDLGQ